MHSRPSVEHTFLCDVEYPQDLETATIIVKHWGWQVKMASDLDRPNDGSHEAATPDFLDNRWCGFGRWCWSNLVLIYSDEVSGRQEMNHPLQDIQLLNSSCSQRSVDLMILRIKVWWWQCYLSLIAGFYLARYSHCLLHLCNVNYI